MNASSGTDSNKLTPRELDIWGLVTKGYSYKKIASELGISVDTVRRHASRIKNKSGLKRTVTLACAGLSIDLIHQLLTSLPAKQPLTTAEIITLSYACTGISSKEIARHRNVSPRTAEKQRETAIAKLGVRSVLELASLVRDQYVNNGIFLDGLIS